MKDNTNGISEGDDAKRFLKASQQAWKETNQTDLDKAILEAMDKVWQKQQGEEEDEY